MPAPDPLLPDFLDYGSAYNTLLRVTRVRLTHNLTISMEKELSDRAERIQKRILQLRDSL